MYFIKKEQCNDPLPHFMDTSVNESQIYLFAVYKQCKEHACPCIDQDVDPIPSMKPAKNMYHDEKKKKKIYIYIYILIFLIN